MTVIGYAYVQDRLKLPLPPVAFPALIRSVTRVERLAGELAVPAKRAPGEDVIEHLLFALKHEGTDLHLPVHDVDAADHEHERRADDDDRAHDACED